jgi:hypothetical protein
MLKISSPKATLLHAPWQQSQKQKCNLTKCNIYIIAKFQIKASVFAIYYKDISAR